MENRYSIEFALQHSNSGTPVPPPSNSVEVPDPEPYPVRIPGSTGPPVATLDATGTITPLQYNDNDNDNNHDQSTSNTPTTTKKPSNITASSSNLNVMLPWIPAYLHLTAYGERFKNFSKNNSKGNRTLMYRLNGKKKKKEARLNDETSEMDYDDDSTEEGMVSPSRYNLPQIYPSRSAAQLDAMGLWHNPGAQRSGGSEIFNNSLTSIGRRVLEEHKYLTSHKNNSNGSRSSGIGFSLPSGSSSSSSRNDGDDDESTEIMSRIELGVPPLPTRWVKQDTEFAITLSNEDSIVEFENDGNGSKNDSFTVRTNYPIPKLCGVYYFEVEILATNCHDELISIGLCDEEAKLLKIPGLETKSWGYHNDDGRIVASQSTAKAYGPKYFVGDIIGCGISFRNNSVFFTKNGLSLGTAFQDVEGTLYPCVGLKAGESIKCNFGSEDFRFDIEKYIRDEKNKIISQDIILNYKQTPGMNGMEMSDFLQELVASYFSNVGYLETAKAFDRERMNNSSNTGTSSSTSATTGSNDSGTMEVDKEAWDRKIEAEIYNRQRIKELLMSGDIDSVLKLLGVFYPTVLENDIIVFKLKCRKFVELVSEATNSNDRDVDMESSTNDLSNTGMNKVLEYGQRLRQQYKNDRRPFIGEHLKRIFALLAYEYPHDAPEVSYLLDREQLGPLAEELNSEMLKSLGKPGTPSLKKLAQHVAQVVWELQDREVSGTTSAKSEINGSSFLNVQNDFLE